MISMWLFDQCHMSEKSDVDAKKNKMCQKIKSDCFKTVHIKRGKHTPGWVLWSLPAASLNRFC